jgi:hypothetical protein
MGLGGLGQKFPSLLVTALYLPLFAMMTACKAGTEENKNWTTGAIRIMVVILQSVYLNGLRILGQKISDLYGPYFANFSVIFFVTYFWVKSNRTLESENLGPEQKGGREPKARTSECLSENHGREESRKTPLCRCAEGDVALNSVTVCSRSILVYCTSIHSCAIHLILFDIVMVVLVLMPSCKCIIVIGHR